MKLSVRDYNTAICALNVAAEMYEESAAKCPELREQFLSQARNARELAERMEE